MTYDAFIESLNEAELPDAMSDELKVLWLLKKDQWEASHNLAQDMDTKDGSLLHAHLHRVEGDDGNAGYWYNRAGEPFSKLSIPDEWDAMAQQYSS